MVWQGCKKTTFLWGAGGEHFVKEARSNFLGLGAYFLKLKFLLGGKLRFP